MNESRQELRRRYIGARKALSAPERASASARIAGRVAAMPEYREASTVLLYRAVPGEVDLRPLAEHSASAGKRFAYPRCVSDTEMAALLPGSWCRGRLGIEEPDPGTSEEVPPEAVDFVVCPGVAFDESGTRLGMGGGFYDRFLPRCVNATVIMAAFEAQRAPFLPRAETDVPMDWVVTEERIVGGGPKRGQPFRPDCPEGRKSPESSNQE